MPQMLRMSQEWTPGEHASWLGRFQLHADLYLRSLLDLDTEGYWQFHETCYWEAFEQLVAEHLGLA